MGKYLKFIMPEIGIDEEDILLYPITSMEVEGRLKRNLSEKKLYRIFTALYSVESIREDIQKAIDEAILLAQDNTQDMWKDVDKRYIDEIVNKKEIYMEQW